MAKKYAYRVDRSPHPLRLRLDQGDRPDRRARPRAPRPEDRLTSPSRARYTRAMNQHAPTVRRPATYQDVLDAPENMVAELIEGALHLHPRPALAHARASSIARRPDRRPLRQRPRRPWRLVDPRRARAAPRRRRARPRPRRLAPRADAGLSRWPRGSSLPPDWVCEVLSPGTRADRPDRQAPPLRRRRRRAPLVRRSARPHPRSLRAPRRRLDPDRRPEGRRGSPRPALRRHRLPALGPLARLTPMPDSAGPRPRRPATRAPTSPSSPTPTTSPAPSRSLNSLARTGTTADIVVLHTGGVDPAALAPLAAKRRPPRRLRPPAHLRRLQRRPLPPRAARPRPLHQGREARLPHPARQLRQAPPLAAPLPARGLPRRRHPRPQAHRPPLRLPRVLRRPERLREPRRLPPPQLRRLHRPPHPRHLRRHARPPRHPRRLLEAHRPDLPRSLLPRLAGPARLRQPAAVRLVQPPRALGLEPRPRHPLPVREALETPQPQGRPPRPADRPLAGLPRRRRPSADLPDP